jgi:predicted short-subunit dehydrogenase-like oxidoreductase (DUF2520 family)
MSKVSERVFVIGVGKVGRGLTAALKAEGTRVSNVSAREFAADPSLVRGDVIVIAARDGAIVEIVRALIDGRALQADSVVVHCAGALDAEVLAPLRPWCAGVAQMHPMMSFANPARPPSLVGGHVHVAGDDEAVRRAKRVCRSIGLVPRTFKGLDRVAYHAAAGLVANGAAALAACGADLLIRAGAREVDVPAMLGPLLRSVADNVTTMGLPEALTGPVRRGDAKALGRHIATLREKAPHLVGIYVACAKAQLPLARALGEATSAQLTEMDQILSAV